MENFIYLIIILSILVFFFLAFIATKSLLWGFILSFLLFVPMIALAMLMLYYHIIHTFYKDYYIKIINEISKKCDISDIEKDLYNFIYYTDIYTDSDLDYANEKFFDILFTCKEKDQLANSITEITKMIEDIAKGDIFKEYRESNRYRSNNWNTKVKNIVITIFSQTIYDFDQDKKSEKLSYFLEIAALIIVIAKIILIFNTGGWISLIFDFILSCLYYILYYSLCKNYEWAACLNSFWFLDIFLLTIYDATHTELFSSFKIIFFLVFRIIVLIFLGMKMLDYFSKLKFQKINKVNTLTFWKKTDLLTKNPFLWEMILLIIFANICMFASFMYPQISRFNYGDIMTGLNCSYKELHIIVCIYNSISNYFSLPLLQYSDTRIITINLLQNIVAFITHTFLFVKIVQNLFSDNHKFVNEEEMSLALCPECGEKISIKATFCPHCGCPIKAKDSPKQVLRKKKETQKRN